MITIKNLRKEKKDGWTYLKVDLDFAEIKNPFPEDTIWFAMKDRDAKMLADDVYDAFVPFVLYLGMYCGQNVHVDGNMSPKLYHNLTHYVMTILENFSEKLQRVKLTSEGLKEAKKGHADLVGAGFSCGVDSLSTIYSNFTEEEDEHSKINSLFFFNCGQNGYFGEKKTYEIWQTRIELHRDAQKSLGLPAYYIDSNLHAFYSKELPINQLGIIGLYCCVISVQRNLRKYYFASCTSYEEILKFGLEERGIDLPEYSESYLLHLFSTELLDMVIDGCEFTRAEKIERIQNWDIAKKSLDVCWNPRDDGYNCGKCTKCARTLLVLESLDKLDEFKDVFDLDTYRKNRHVNLCNHIVDRNPQNMSLISYLKSHGIFLPPRGYAYVRYFFFRLHRKLNWIKEYGTWRNDRW